MFAYVLWDKASVASDRNVSSMRRFFVGRAAPLKFVRKLCGFLEIKHTLTPTDKKSSKVFTLLSSIREFVYIYFLCGFLELKHRLTIREFFYIYLLKGPLLAHAHTYRQIN